MTLTKAFCRNCGWKWGKTIQISSRIFRSLKKKSWTKFRVRFSIIFRAEMSWNSIFQLWNFNLLPIPYPVDTFLQKAFSHSAGGRKSQSISTWIWRKILSPDSFRLIMQKWLTHRRNLNYDDSSVKTTTIPFICDLQQFYVPNFTHSRLEDVRHWDNLLSKDKQ